jgi:YVTN family beta-propeller protein
MVYVANENENTLSAIDAKTLKEVARIPVHEDPKRISTVLLPE